jgi:hypothetical protein
MKHNESHCNSPCRSLPQLGHKELIGLSIVSPHGSPHFGSGGNELLFEWAQTLAVEKLRSLKSLIP